MRWLLHLGLKDKKNKNSLKAELYLRFVLIAHGENLAY